MPRTMKRKKKRTVSPETRAKMSAAQKARRRRNTVTPNTQHEIQKHLDAIVLLVREDTAKSVVAAIASHGL